MELTLILSMLLFCSICNGQVIHSKNLKRFQIDDSGNIRWIHTGTNDSVPFTGVKVITNQKMRDTGNTSFGLIDSLDGQVFFYPNIQSQKERKRDTVMAIIIAIDTKTGMTSSSYFFHPLDQATNDRRIVYWINGYVVREKHDWIERDISDSQNPSYWEYINYLNENKQPLEGGVIVLITKEIN